MSGRVYMCNFLFLIGQLYLDFFSIKVHTHNLYMLLCRACDWEQQYKSRESRPEDLDKIRELELTTNQLKMKTKDLIVSHRRGSPKMLALVLSYFCLYLF